MLVVLVVSGEYGDILNLYEPLSKLPKGGYIGDYIGDYYRGY